MLVALETSTRTPSVAVRSGARVASVVLSAERAHASDLLPALDRLLHDLGAQAGSIAAVLVGTGPGSYTGLRVGIATALGLARGSGARILGVPSGEALAFGELAPGETGVVVLDARQGEIYFAAFRRLALEVEIVEAPCVVAPAAVASRIPPDARIFADATAERVLGLDAATRARVVLDRAPSAEALLALGSLRLARGIEHATAAVEPLYLRPFTSGSHRKT